MVCEIVLTTHGKLKFLYVCLEQLQEQIEWAVESGADFIVAETFSDYKCTRRQNWPCSASNCMEMDVR